MQLGICAEPATLRGLSASLPFDFIEGHVRDFLIPEAPDADFAPRAAALRASSCPMPAANCFLPPDLKVTGPVIDWARLERYAAVAFRRAKEIGAGLIVFGSGDARRVPEGFSTAKAFEQFVDVLRRIGPLAQAQGVTIVVEPLNRGECNLVNTVIEGAEAVVRADTPAVKLLVDIYHMLLNGEASDDIVKVGPHLRHAHIAEKDQRTAPGVKGDDFRPFLRALKQAGYDGRLTIECRWGDLASEVGPSLAALRAQLADAGY